MIRLSTLVLVLISFISFAQLPPESDPHRGMYLDRFVKQKLTSYSPDPTFSILAVDTNSDGIFEKEDTYLEYACENHITYIAIYDLGKITNGGMTGWNENTKRYENLEDHLCRFMEKAKHQYGVTQIGGVVGSAGAVTDLEQYMNRYPVAPGCTTCQADFDVITIENEFWGDCNGDLPAFITIMDAMYNYKQSYNAAHPNNKMTTDAYLADLGYCAPVPGLGHAAEIFDGCTNCSPFAGCSNPHPRKIDRMLYSILSPDPTHYTFTEINSFEGVNTYDSTDFHPMFYAEGTNSAGTYDFFGPWLSAKPLNTIFIAEDYFYYWWARLSGNAMGTPRANDVQPGGCHWFAGSHMVGWLDHPLMIQVTEPYCTTDSAKITLHYVGPDEYGTKYKLWVSRNSDNAVVYPQTQNAFTGISENTALHPGYRTINFNDTLQFPSLYLPPGDYTAHIELAYNFGTGCSYSSEQKFFVDTRPRLQVSGDTAFCNGKQTFLSTIPGATTYTWYRNGIVYDGATKDTLRVVDGGDYYCVLTGGSCPATTDTIHITVHVLPHVEVNATCNGNTVTFKTDLLPANSSSTNPYGQYGLTYIWNTGATTDQITVSTNATGSYRVQITDPYSGCSIYRHLSLPDSLANYTAITTVNQQPHGCAHDGWITASLTPSPIIYQPVRYLWSNGATAATIGNLAAGTYSVSMSTYGNACSYYSTVTIGTPATSTVNETISPSPCSNTAGGSITLNPVGGPFTYSWPNIPDENGYSSVAQNQSNLFPGIYEAYLTDTNGCTSHHSFTVGKSDGPVKITPGTISPVSGCSTNQTGSATVNITGGSSPYSQIWIDNAAQSFPNGNILSAGSYKVIATDNAGCTGYSYIHVPAVNPPLHIDILDSTNISLTCDSMSDGRYYACIHGGSQPYSIDSQWVINGNIASLENLAPGNYSFTIMDGMGCTLTDSFTVTSSNLIMSSVASHTHCIGCADGSISVSYSGGMAPHSISWSPMNGSLTGTTILNVLAGNYTICVTDSNQCIYCDNVTVQDDPLHTGSLSSKGFSLFPNPTRGSFRIHCSKCNSNLRMIITDVYGQQTMFDFSPDELIRNADLKSGMYFISIFENQNEVARTKVVVID
jgi:hypothetical protein